MSTNSKQLGAGPACGDRLEWLHALVNGQPNGIAIIAAHPDDEIIGAGTQLRRWQKPQIVLVTDGAPPDSRDAQRAGYEDARAYAASRLKESISALALVGVEPSQVHPLGFQDQCTAFNLSEIVWRLAELLSELRPKAVITHCYEGGHPDHDSVAFATRVACSVSEVYTGFSPVIFEMTSYHNQNGSMQTGTFLPGPANEHTATARWSAEDRALKEQLYSCFRTQQKVLQYFPLQPERFRCAPQYDFNQPPHSGSLYYEFFNWGMTGREWRRLANDAKTQITRELQKQAPAIFSQLAKDAMPIR